MKSQWWPLDQVPSDAPALLPMYQCEALDQFAPLARCPSLHLDTHQATAELQGQRGAQGVSSLLLG